MALFDQFKKAKQEKKNQTTPPPEGHTLAEVMKDKKHSDLFGKLLKGSGNTALAEKMAEGKLDQGDIEVLEEQRKIFSEKITKAEKMEEFLSEENIVVFAHNNPDFQKIINLVGPEKAAKVIQAQLKEISITDEDRFNKIVKKINARESHKNGQYKAINDKVEELLKEKGITPEEYLGVLAIADPTEKEEALKQLSYRKNGGFKRAFNAFSHILGQNWLKDTTLDDLKDSAISTEEQVKLLNAKEKQVGSSLFTTISENDAVRASFFGELSDDKAPEQLKGGFGDAKKDAFREKQFNDNWEHEKDEEDYYTKTPAEQDLIKDAFIQKAKDHHKKLNAGQGFWGTIFYSITEALINSKKATLK